MSQFPPYTTKIGAGNSQGIMLKLIYNEADMNWQQ